MKTAALLCLMPALFGMAAFAQDPHAHHQAPPTPPPAPAPAGEPDTAAALPVGDAPPPPVIRDHLTDRVFGAASMDRAREVLAREHGGVFLTKTAANFVEITQGSGDTGYRWDVEGLYGTDLDRFVFKSEGEGIRDEVDTAEIQGLYSRAVGRYTNLQAGIRYDFEPDGLAYATVGVETLFPYWFDTEGALFLSERGDTFARVEGSYDLRFTQRVILQPRVELTLAAQDVPESDIGAGFSFVEFGLRLRYDIRREFAPYIGVNFESSLGDTRDFRRAAGEDPDEWQWVAGIRAWF